MWQLRMHCNLRPPDAAPVILRLIITTPTPSLKSVNLSVAVLQRFTADTLRYAVTLTFDHVTTLTCGLLTLDICSVSAVT